MNVICRSIFAFDTEREDLAKDFNGELVDRYKSVPVVGCVSDFSVAPTIELGFDRAGLCATRFVSPTKLFGLCISFAEKCLAGNLDELRYPSIAISIRVWP